ncbi:acyl carrier protein mbtL [Mycolicibacterium chitae]|uniref:Acyl carrier protein mbtL n=2 Tax=Mycolicibacterium chitae TaxID=1792 RepID=A0A448IBG2_MYCCI|nr:acyl carrier protein mbtL [Mycolicibacterium chitae]
MIGVRSAFMASTAHLSVSNSLSEILCNDLNIDSCRISRDSRLVTDVCLDWTGFTIAAAAIEAKLGIVLSEQELLDSSTIGELDDILEAKTAGGLA